MEYKTRVRKFKLAEAANDVHENVEEETHEQLVRDRFARIQEIIWQMIRPRFEAMRAAVDENGYKAEITEAHGGPADEDPLYVTSIALSIEGPPKGSISYRWEGYRFKISTCKNTDLEDAYVGLDALDEKVVHGHCDAFMEKMFPTR